MRASPAASNIWAEGKGATAKSAKLASSPLRLSPKAWPRTCRLSWRLAGSFVPRARNARASRLTGKTTATTRRKCSNTMPSYAGAAAQATVRPTVRSPGASHHSRAEEAAVSATRGHRREHLAGHGLDAHAVLPAQTSASRRPDGRFITDGDSSRVVAARDIRRSGRQPGYLRRPSRPHANG